MNNLFRAWLKDRFPTNVAQSRLSNAIRIEEAYGDLDEHYAKDKLDRVLSDLEYSSDDQEQRVLNRSKIRFSPGADVYNGLNTLRSATRLYVEFREKDSSSKYEVSETGTAAIKTATPEEEKLERLQELNRAANATVEELTKSRDMWRLKAEDAERRLSGHQQKSWWRWFMG
jgi:hypothetical protein